MVALKSDTSQTRTRQQLLEAAGQVFAEHGYRAATVREICLRAGANVASIHYHFGDKERLYIAVLRYAHERSNEANPDLSRPNDSNSPEEQLKIFVRSFLTQLLERSPLAWDGKLIAREMVEPTSAIDIVIDERMKPLSKRVRDIVRSLLGVNATEDSIRESEFSIVSQCVFYHHCREAILRLYPKFKATGPEIDKLADHITAFSLAGLKAKAQRK
ncbi:MAG: transcriptional regulator, TetR family [Verrucomicrobiales bacterium]|nr:transcriptional regulator, TetR family [Verrucomicrobiales bacterium]